MGAMSIRDYAIKNGISYQAVRKTVNKYMEDIKDHISVQNRTQYLDDEAQAFLDEKRRVNPIVILEETSREEIEELKAELESKAQMIIDLQKKVIDLQDSKADLLEYKAKTELLLEDKKKAEEELKATNGVLTETQIKLSEAEKEATSYKKTLFGLYKKV